MSQPAFDFGDEHPDDAANPTYTVGELAGAVNDTLRTNFREGVWVRGEITGWSDRGSHAYFTLADDADGDRAVLHVQFFANVRAKLRPLLRKHRLRLADGMKVRVFGYLDYYAPTGRFGLKMAGLDPRYTLGEIAQGRDEVVRRLVADGVFDANRATRLSPIPLRVGVVTSVGTAAWHDFHDELDRSGLGFVLHVADTRVQGDMADRLVAAAIGTLSRRPDLDTIVVIRGGGARNELAVFDAEVIARTIAASPVPVLTGLGHEIDRSVADDVAHLALKTPTACAGELIGRVRAYLDESEAAFRAIVRRSHEAVDDRGQQLTHVAHQIARRTHAAVERADERLGVRVDHLVRRAPQAIEVVDARLVAAARRLADRSLLRVERETGRCDLLQARLAAVDPTVQLARGWSITRRDDGTIVRRTSDAPPGSILETTLIDGAVYSSVPSDVPGAASAPTERTDRR
jgi:exodeoxyribonuclease VII large subunit